MLRLLTIESSTPFSLQKSISLFVYYYQNIPPLSARSSYWQCGTSFKMNENLHRIAYATINSIKWASRYGKVCVVVCHPRHVTQANVCTSFALLHNIQFPFPFKTKNAKLNYFLSSFLWLSFFAKKARILSFYFLFQLVTTSLSY